MSTPNNQSRPKQSASSSTRSRSQRTSRTGSSRSHRPGASSMAVMQQKLSEMGSYAKYFKAIQTNPFQVKLRCSCGRSRNMAWMFFCTFCATGTKVEKEKKKEAKKDSNVPLSSLKKREEIKEEEDDDDEKYEIFNNSSTAELGLTGNQRLYLSCDLCSTKATESYFCPHCLAAFPAHYVKLHTRCTRCVGCPVCNSPLEKIVYSGSTNMVKSNDKSSSENQTKNKKKKDVYLYQCPFCFWSSNIIGLESLQSEELLDRLKEQLKAPEDTKKLIMESIAEKYKKINEELREQEDKNEQHKRWHKYKGTTSFLKKDDIKIKINNKTAKKNRNNKFKLNKNRNLTLHNIQLSSLNNLNTDDSSLSAKTQQSISTLNNLLDQKFIANHVLCPDHVQQDKPPVDLKYISQYHLRNVSPLYHRLNSPLTQSIDMNKYTPKRFHLLSKESYRCPQKNCGKFVCKPTLRGRQANYDKRTAVLDYLPRVNIQLSSGNLQNGSQSIIIIMFASRHLIPIELQCDSTINSSDLYSTANIECSDDWYTLGPADIHIKGTGDEYKKIIKPNGDYMDGKECGIHFKVKPKFYTEPRNIKFSVKVTMKTEMQIKDDITKVNEKATLKQQLLGIDPINEPQSGLDSLNEETENDAFKTPKVTIPVILPFILDFDLGPPKIINIPKPTLPTIPTTTTDNQSDNSGGHKSRGSSENLLNQ